MKILKIEKISYNTVSYTVYLLDFDEKFMYVAIYFLLCLAKVNCLIASSLVAGLHRS